MFSLIQAKLLDPQFMAMVLVAVATAATVWTIAMPLIESDGLAKRMKTVAIERERIRARERERLAKAQARPSLRQQPKAYMRQIVTRFRLDRWLGTETAKAKLMMAGYRGQHAEVAFLFFRLVTPIGFLLGSSFYFFVLKALDRPTPVLVTIVIGCVYAGVKAPEVFLANTISKRQASITAAWPDALDLLLICVESGMSIETAFRRVSVEVGTQSVPLAEELTLTTAELSYLPDRRQAYDNFASRTGLESVKAVGTALNQAERYGTPLGQALRVLAQESRDIRMNEAEKKAAALPPKLTVPMIVFFLPVLFVVILTPALIQVMGWK
ncbi:MAG TPA: type II secretion system F family protein [Microvirga sp.]|nr:type II secretion system F family protein [Microvirga sp.]